MGEEGKEKLGDSWRAGAHTSIRGTTPRSFVISRGERERKRERTIATHPPSHPLPWTPPGKLVHACSGSARRMFMPALKPPFLLRASPFREGREYYPYVDRSWIAFKSEESRKESWTWDYEGGNIWSNVNNGGGDCLNEEEGSARIVPFEERNWGCWFLLMRVLVRVARLN